MSATVTPPRDRRAERAAATRREILDAAWALARSAGPAALSMRELGARVGMRAQSLYVYFPSKHAIFDEMFAEANRELLARMTAIRTANDPVERLRLSARAFLAFCVEDLARYQLLFQRPVPGFEPSAEAMVPALQTLELTRSTLRDCRATGAGALDEWTALTGGLAAQQTANEPGGTRWVSLLDDMLVMFLDHHRSQRRMP